MKKLFLLSICLLCALLTQAQNLLADGGFEQCSANAIFGLQWHEWTCTARTEAATDDKLEGNQSMRFLEANSTGKVQQEVSMTTEADGQTFRLTIHYKVLQSTTEQPVSLACVWESSRDGVLAHDEDILTQTLEVSNEWKEVVVTTTKPAGANKLHVGIAYSKKTLLMLDDWSLVRAETGSTEPYMTVTPASVPQVSANVGESKIATTFTIRQGNLSGPVSVYLNGKNAAMFSIDKQSLSAAEETITLTYKPTAAGSHTANICFDPSKNTELFTMIKITAAASQPGATPEITITPTSLPHFTCAAGETVTDTVHVNAINCTNYVEITLLNQGNQSAFSVNNSLMPANIQNGLSIITFHPLEAGEYSATVWYQTEGGQACRIDLTGTATAAGGGSTETFATEFVFDNQNPHALLVEHFDAVGRNTPLALEDWQNVVKAGNRPWWGIDKINDEDMYCAKATAFVSGQTDNTEWEQWLITPALDYKNAINQVFTFRVRGDYLFDEMTTSLTLYYIDAIDATDVYMQPLEVGIPATADESGDWVEIHVNLMGQETIADVFYMAFRYQGPSGIDGAPTYYVDDVTWGNPDTEVTQTTTDALQATKTKKVLVNGQLLILHNGLRYTIMGTAL